MQSTSYSQCCSDAVCLIVRIMLAARMMLVSCQQYGCSQQYGCCWQYGCYQQYGRCLLVVGLPLRCTESASASTVLYCVVLVTVSSTVSPTGMMLVLLVLVIRWTRGELVLSGVSYHLLLSCVLHGSRQLVDILCTTLLGLCIYYIIYLMLTVYSTVYYSVWTTSAQYVSWSSCWSSAGSTPRTSYLHTLDGWWHQSYQIQQCSLVSRYSLWDMQYSIHYR